VILVPRTIYMETQYQMKVNNYAGIYAYSYKNKVPLTYLSTELEYPLEEEEVYCIRMMVSLSDLSKYACNNVGLYISNQRPTSRQIQSYAIEPQILASKNRIVEEQYTFISICRMYKAEGGEKFIVIGNFAKPEDTKWKKMKRPKGFHTPQSYDAYYYIEGVSVIPMDSIEECSCEKGGIKMNVVYSENISAEANDEEEKLIANTKAYFEFNKTEILPNSKAQLDSMINMLISKPSLKLEIIGYTEEQEQLKLSDDEDISLDRAKVVFDYLVSKGIKSDRMIYKGNKDSNPVDDSNTTVARSKNRRVEFKLVK